MTAEGCPACSERMGISAVLPPGDVQPVPHHSRKSRWKRLKKANPPVISQNSPLVITQGLQLSRQSVTSKHLLGAPWRAKPAGSPQDTAWAEGPAPSPPHLGTLTLTPTTCPAHGTSIPLPITVRHSRSPPGASRTHRRHLPNPNVFSTPVTSAFSQGPWEQLLLGGSSRSLLPITAPTSSPSPQADFLPLLGEVGGGARGWLISSTTGRDSH